MKIVLLGPPGAGKGTIASLLKEKFGVQHISTGDILREEMKSESSLGLQVKGYVEGGELVPDEVVTAIIENKLKRIHGSNEGYLLDGFPRTSQQAGDLDKILNQLGQPIDAAVYMEATLPVIIQRLTGRRVCRECGALYHKINKIPNVDGQCDQCSGELYQRPDDNEETIKTRMEVYLSSTAPIIDYYKKQGKLKKLDADKDSEDLLIQLTNFLNEDQGPNQDQISR